MAGVLGDLLIPVAEAYLADRRSNGSKTSTRHGDAMSIKAFGSWLANNRKYPQAGASVFRDLKGGKARGKDSREQRPLDDDELARLLGTFNITTFCGLRNGTLIRLMLDCGCRLGEALGALDTHIAWTRNEVEIVGKTGTRSVKFSEETASWLAAYRKARQRIVQDGIEELIVTDEGTPMTESGAHSMFIRLRAQAKIRRLHAHLLRHTWATNYRRFGCGDLLDLQERGGWVDLAMVRRDSKIRPEAERQMEQAPLDRMRAANSGFKVADYTSKKRMQNKLNKLFKRSEKDAA